MLPLSLLFCCSSLAAEFCSMWSKRQMPFRWNWVGVLKVHLINMLWERRVGQGRTGDTKENLPRSPLLESCRHYPLLLEFPASVKRVEKRISPGLLDPWVLLNPWEIKLSRGHSSFFGKRVKEKAQLSNIQRRTQFEIMKPQCGGLRAIVPRIPSQVMASQLRHPWGGGSWSIARH